MIALKIYLAKKNKNNKIMKKIIIITAILLTTVISAGARDYLNKGIHYEVMAGFNQPYQKADNPFAEFKIGYTFSSKTNISACVLANFNTNYDVAIPIQLTAQIKQYIGAINYELPLHAKFFAGTNEVGNKFIFGAGGGFTHNVNDNLGLQCDLSLDNEKCVKLGLGLIF